MLKNMSLYLTAILSRYTSKKPALSKYADKLEKGVGKSTDTGPHMNFKIVSGDSFKDDMRKFYADNPEITKDVGSVDTESDWFSKSLSFLLPILLFVGLWILLMRKMGGGAGGGAVGGPVVFSILVNQKLPYLIKEPK